MEVFCFRAGGPETLEAFNLRLADFAASNDVVGVVSSVIGTTLVLSLALTSDMVASSVAVRPLVMVVEAGHEAGLEAALTEVINAAKAEDKPDGGCMSVPLELRALSAPANPVLGYVVMQVIVGEMEE